MKTQFKAASILLLCAMLLSFVPAAMTAGSVSAAQTCTDRAQFVSDVTVPDGTRYEPGTAFKKTWRLKNVGTCTWTTSYSLVFDSGERMGGPASTAFTGSVAPGATVDLTVDLTAPTAAGRYIGYWKFKNAAGALFGIGPAATKSWWVEINVTSSAPTGSVALDFVSSVKDATWSSGAGGISVNGTDGDAKGFVLVKDKPKFENGVEFSKPGLLLAPQNITNGFIQGVYPAFKVEGGDSFQTTVGCEAGATTCYVAYRLDYEVGGVVKTFWTFRERFEGLTYNANISLAPLAGQTAKFILYISAFGSPAGDRALWGNPVITRKGIVPPPVTITPGGPTVTPTNTPGPVTATVQPSACDKAQFVADVNVPDGTTFQPGATFTKTWRLKNVGTCAWSKSYLLVFFSGEQMGASSSAAFPQDVAVGQTVNISMNMTAPSAAGSYRGYWMFKNASGALFGIGAQANKPWWVDIKVSGPTVTPGGPTRTPTPTVTPGGPTVTPNANSAYDFATNACAASWFSGAGALPCPGTETDNRGFVLKITNPKMETGAIDPRPAILTFPQALNNGYIQGFYPPFRVQSGDRFRSTINCEGGATLCYVAFRLDYQTGSDPIRTFWGPFLERVDNPPRFYDVDVDLSSLAGKDVKFILTVLAAGNAQLDRALWVGPYIYRVGATSSAITPAATTAVPTTAVPTTAIPTTAIPPTATTPASSTSYQNSRYNFKFTLPAGSTIASQTDNLARINLPLVTPGTNLSEKYIQVSVTEGLNPCAVTEFEGGTAIEHVTVNNIQFDKQSGQGIAAGNIYDWTGYSTVRNNACIIVAFILHSTNPANHATPPPVFDKAQESAVFDTTMNTFNWLSSSGGATLISDDFSSPGWGTGSDADSSVSYENNTLKFLVSAKNFFVWSNPNGFDYQDVHMEVTAFNNSTDPTTTFGMMCDQHAEDGFSFYFFAMTPAGEYAIIKAESGQADVFLTNNGQWGFSDSIAQNAASYRIGADCGRGTLTMYIDGRQIASVSDSTYTSGSVALFTWSGEDMSATNVSFDNFLMTEL